MKNLPQLGFLITKRDKTNKQNHLLISYDDKPEPADDSEWGKEYARTLQHFEILKAKLNVSREHAIDTFDRLTESDTKILDKCTIYMSSTGSCWNIIWIP